MFRGLRRIVFDDSSDDEISVTTGSCTGGSSPPEVEPDLPRIFQRFDEDVPKKNDSE